MKTSVKGMAAGLACLTFAAVATAETPPTFTGSVPHDFVVGGDVVTVVDPGGVADVVIPDGGACGELPPVSGWDMNVLRLYYDRPTDTMYVGLDFVAICGDADNDGDPSTTGSVFTCLGASDLPDLGGSESVSVQLDTNMDGTPDVIVGVSAMTDVTGFTAATFVPGNPPPLAFGAPLPSNTGALFGPIGSARPDVEFTILNFSTLPGFALPSPQTSTIRFAISAFAGSSDDAGIGDDLVNPTLVTLLCEGFDALPTNTEVNTQFAGEGLLVDGASHTGFAGVYTFRQSDDPGSPDNPPVTEPNILRTKSTPTDLAGDEGRINFHFVDPLNGTSPLGATVASLYVIDITSSGGGTPDGSTLNVFDPNDVLVSVTPVPVGAGGEQQLVTVGDPIGRIQTLQARLGFSGDSDSGTCDLLRANLNPVSLQTVDITSGGFTTTAGASASITMNLYSKRRVSRRIKLFFRDSMGAETLVVQHNFRFTQSPPLGRVLTRSVPIPLSLTPGDYTLHIQTIATANPFVPQTILHDSFVPVTIQ